ncbi:MAG: quinone oxidoreductase [Acidimicrobiia bacterium]
MRAIVIEEPGGEETLRYQEVDDPSPSPGELLVEVAAAGLNFIDTYHRSGLYPMEFPFTPGVEGAGTVLEVGNGVEGFATGDRVAWCQGIGSYAEKKCVSVDHAVPVPDDIDLETAAASLLQGLTAHYLATDTFPLSSGDQCLVHAGAGGVGLLLTQIAARKGARVITTVGSREKEELSRGAGASDVLVYTESDFKQEVEALVGPRALDVVYDGVGKATFDDGLDLLRPRGMMVTFGNASGPVPEVSPLVLMQKGSLYLTRPTLGDYLRTRAELETRVGDLFSWIATGDLSIHIAHRYPLSEASDAHRALEGRSTTGKVLLIPDQG